MFFRPEDLERLHEKNKAPETIQSESAAAYAPGTQAQPAGDTNPQPSSEYLPPVSFFDSTNAYPSADYANAYFAASTFNDTASVGGWPTSVEAPATATGDVPSGDSLPNTSGPSGDGKGWTYLIDDAVTLTFENGTKTGAPLQYDQYKELADKTAGTQDQIYVQTSNTNDPTVNLIRIADGKIEDLGDHESAGFADDVKNLASYAPAEGHVALMISAHGAANEGFQGDNGYATIKEVTDALQTGKDIAGRTENFDLVGLDGCLTSAATPTSTVGKVADVIIASETREYSGDQSVASDPGVRKMSGMSTVDALQNLLGKEPQDGMAVGHEILQQSQLNCPPDANLCGADTLALIDTKEGAQFNQALSEFGSALAKASQDQDTREAIDNIIDRSPEVSHSARVDEPDLELRDLKAFVTNIQQAIDNGTITDTDNSLHDAAANTIIAQDKYVPEHYSVDSVTAPNLGLDQSLNGLSVFLPGNDYSLKIPDSDTRSKTEDSVDSSISQVEGFSAGLEQSGNDLKSGAITPEKASADTIQRIDGLIKTLPDIHGQQYDEATDALAKISTSLLIQSRSGTLDADALNKAAMDVKTEVSQPLQDNRDQIVNDASTGGLTSLYKTQQADDPAEGWENYINAVRVPEAAPAPDVEAPDVITPPDLTLNLDTPGFNYSDSFSEESLYTPTSFLPETNFSSVDSSSTDNWSLNYSFDTSFSDSTTLGYAGGGGAWDEYLTASYGAYSGS